MDSGHLNNWKVGIPKIFPLNFHATMSTKLDFVLLNPSNRSMLSVEALNSLDHSGSRSHLHIHTTSDVITHYQPRLQENPGVRSIGWSVVQEMYIVIMSHM